MLNNLTIVLVGESGSGKTTLAELIEKELGFKNIPSFTTRKPRYENEAGHIFTTKKQYECNKANRLIVAETYFDGNYYWTTKGQFEGKTVYVVDPVGIKYLKENANWEVIVIYLKASRICRVSRMLKRAGYGLCVQTPIRVYDPIAERATHDDKAFKNIEYDYEINAQNSIEEVLEDVKSIIDSENLSIEQRREAK